jgi:hypothetical protein
MCTRYLGIGWKVSQVFRNWQRLSETQAAAHFFYHAQKRSSKGKKGPKGNQEQVFCVARRKTTDFFEKLVKIREIDIIVRDSRGQPHRAET